VLHPVNWQIYSGDGPAGWALKFQQCFTGTFSTVESQKTIVISLTMLSKKSL